MASEIFLTPYEMSRVVRGKIGYLSPPDAERTGRQSGPGSHRPRGRAPAAASRRGTAPRPRPICLRRPDQSVFCSQSMVWGGGRFRGTGTVSLHVSSDGSGVSPGLSHRSIQAFCSIGPTFPDLKTRNLSTTSYPFYILYYPKIRLLKPRRPAGRGEHGGRLQCRLRFALADFACTQSECSPSLPGRRRGGGE